MPCGATLDGRVMVERSDRMWSTGEGNDKPLQYSCLENPMNSMKRQNDRILPGSVFIVRMISSSIFYLDCLSLEAKQCVINFYITGLYNIIRFIYLIIFKFIQNMF